MLGARRVVRFRISPKLREEVNARAGEVRKGLPPRLKWSFRNSKSKNISSLTSRSKEGSEYGK